MLTMANPIMNHNYGFHSHMVIKEKGHVTNAKMFDVAYTLSEPESSLFSTWPVACFSVMPISAA